VRGRERAGERASGTPDPQEAMCGWRRGSGGDDHRAAVSGDTRPTLGTLVEDPGLNGLLVQSVYLVVSHKCSITIMAHKSQYLL